MTTPVTTEEPKRKPGRPPKKPGDPKGKYTRRKSTKKREKRLSEINQVDPPQIENVQPGRAFSPKTFTRPEAMIAPADGAEETKKAVLRSGNEALSVTPDSPKPDTQEEPSEVKEEEREYSYPDPDSHFTIMGVSAGFPWEKALDYSHWVDQVEANTPFNRGECELLVKAAAGPLHHMTTGGPDHKPSFFVDLLVAAGGFMFLRNKYAAQEGE